MDALLPPPSSGSLHSGPHLELTGEHLLHLSKGKHLNNDGIKVASKLSSHSASTDLGGKLIRPGTVVSHRSPQQEETEAVHTSEIRN